MEQLTIQEIDSLISDNEEVLRQNMGNAHVTMFLALKISALKKQRAFLAERGTPDQCQPRPPKNI